MIALAAKGIDDRVGQGRAVQFLEQQGGLLADAEVWIPQQRQDVLLDLRRPVAVPQEDADALEPEEPDAGELVDQQ